MKDKEIPNHVKTVKELVRHIPKLNTQTGEITYGISMAAMNHNWLQKSDNPGKTLHGYHVATWREYVLKSLQESQHVTAGGYDLKDEKTRAQIDNIKVSRERNEEKLKQERIETAKMRNELVATKDVDAEIRRMGSVLRGTVESYRQHSTAKHPSRREVIDGVCDGFLKALCECEEERGEA